MRVRIEALSLVVVASCSFDWDSLDPRLRDASVTSDVRLVDAHGSDASFDAERFDGAADGSVDAAIDGASDARSDAPLDALSDSAIDGAADARADGSSDVRGDGSAPSAALEYYSFSTGAFVGAASARFEMGPLNGQTTAALTAGNFLGVSGRSLFVLSPDNRVSQYRLSSMDRPSNHMRTATAALSATGMFVTYALPAALGAMRNPAYLGVFDEQLWFVYRRPTMMGPPRRCS